MSSINLYVNCDPNTLNSNRTFRSWRHCEYHIFTLSNQIPMMLSLHYNTTIITVQLRINWLTTGLTRCPCVGEYLHLRTRNATIVCDCTYRSISWCASYKKLVVLARVCVVFNFLLDLFDVKSLMFLCLIYDLGVNW